GPRGGSTVAGGAADGVRTVRPGRGPPAGRGGPARVEARDALRPADQGPATARRPAGGPGDRVRGGGGGAGGWGGVGRGGGAGRAGGESGRAGHGGDRRGPAGDLGTRSGGDADDGEPDEAACRRRAGGRRAVDRGRGRRAADRRRPDPLAPRSAGGGHT